MKNYLVILFMMIGITCATAQATPLEKVFRTYLEKPGFETTEILPGSTSFQWQKETDPSGINEMLKEVQQIRIMRYNGEGKTDRAKFWKELNKAADNDQYSEVVEVKSGENQARILYWHGQSGDIKEFALIADGKDGIVLLMVSGTMNFRKYLSPETMQQIRQMGQYYLQSKGECVDK